MNLFHSATSWLAIWLYISQMFGATLGDVNNEDCLNRFVNPVDMTNCNITQLDPYHFSRFHYIRTFDMSDNVEFDFPANGTTFLYQESLFQYYCVNCGITAIHKNTFAGLPQLKSVNLSSNRIKAIPSEAFNFNEINFLFLANNQIKRFNELHRLETMQHLWLLDVSVNEGFDLYDMSMDFRRLERLLCDRCNLSSISEQWLSKLVRLKKLYLDNNSIEVVPPGCVKNNRVLKYLNLNNNPIQELAIESETLETLSCTACNISRLTDKNFELLPSLKVLHLQNNSIESVDPLSFASNPVLTVLQLDNNNLTSFSIEILRTSRALQQLCLDNNYFQPKPKFTELSNLYTLLQLRKDCAAGTSHRRHFENIVPSVEVEGNSLYEKDLPPCGSSVDISNRNVVFIDPMAYHTCQSLKVLNMNENKNFSSYKHYPLLYNDWLESYSCENCGIRVIYEATFAHLPKLQTVHLRKNHLTKISYEAFRSNPILRHIDIDANKLQILPVQLLSSHTNVTDLIVSHNPELTFTSTLPFVDQPVVEKFIAKHCAIKRVTSTSFGSMPALVEINISDNPIDFIDQRAFENNLQLEILDLSNTRLRMIPAEAIVPLKLVTLCLAGMTDTYEFEDPAQRENNAQLKELMAGKQSSCSEGDQFVRRLLPAEDQVINTTAKPELAAEDQVINITAKPELALHRDYYRASSSSWVCRGSTVASVVTANLVSVFLRWI